MLCIAVKVLHRWRYVFGIFSVVESPGTNVRPTNRSVINYSNSART
jgi:hypothetical protein